MVEIWVGDQIVCVRQSGPTVDGETPMVTLHGVVLEVHNKDEYGKPAEDGQYADWYWVRSNQGDEFCVSAQEAVTRQNTHPTDG
ncbi:hypothetical protein ACFYO1_39075 [Nocardia sp. NPDC006044]|uniref:hypothetical protein n=1 Tax=Nocardia sp. NPDC006044 TaxID=3364306 RepID=UPI0036AA6AE9